MAKVQWRSIVEWEYDTDTNQQRVLRQWTTPLEGYKRKEKPKTIEVKSVQSEGTESW